MNIQQLQTRKEFLVGLFQEVKSNFDSEIFGDYRIQKMYTILLNAVNQYSKDYYSYGIAVDEGQLHYYYAAMEIDYNRAINAYNFLRKVLNF